MTPTSSLEHIRHSLAHLLAAAVLELYPDTKNTIGPAIENGFYYDFDLGDTKLSDEDLPAIEQKMREILKSWEHFEKIDETHASAKDRYAHNPYKLELIEEVVAKSEPLTSYRSGEFIDLCRGGHVERIKDIDPKAFKLTHVAGAYWRGNEKNKMLTRIYGLAFATKQELEEHIAMLEEAKKRDHKKLGAELDLFFIDEEVGKGLPMWTPKGTIMKFELEQFTRWLEYKYGYQHVSTPYLGSERLYHTSGHLSHYKSNMYAPIDMDGDVFYLRPMACPHHIRMLLRKPISYKDLPVRYAEIADYNRYEKSGELMGMIRVRKFQLTDAHIFVSPDGLKEEFKQVCALIQEGMHLLGLSDIISYRFSKRDPYDKEKYYADEVMWDNAERVMKEALNEMSISYTEALGEAAFYGPKLDVQAQNANGKEDTLFTAQIDFLLPEKFDITYTDSDGNKKRPVMIHRSAIGSLERTFAFLIEHYAGAFPTWLSPVQAVVVPIAESHHAWAIEVHQKLLEAGVRAQLDANGETLGKRIREAEKQKIPYILIMGDKEVNAKAVAVRRRGKGDAGAVALPDFISNISQEISARS